MPITDNVDYSLEYERYSFEELFDKEKKGLYLTALFLLKDAQDAEDLLQEVAITAFLSFKSLKDKRSFKPWISKILINKTKRYKYNLFRKIQKEILFVQNAVAFENPISEEDILLKDELIKLPYNERLIITLRYFSGFTINEIAHLTKVPEGTIKSKIHRTLNKLKKNIERE
ncbi:RNA polymerase sigma factor [Bacillus alkalicellulosilyticus]|uniref:RNA polymerase sigma factor n=1 Tax=Alkalihalobacterium alkalicellulosilyticum TaxID=1912214 RepID=UPI0009971895|nr:sigma-70 family RNA polymerase sigma factor [Bacillus alkalicellulosilyticus]